MAVTKNKPTDRQALIAAIKRRMADLDWSRADLERELNGEVAHGSLYGFLAGEQSMRFDQLAKVLRALGWDGDFRWKGK